MRIIEYDDSYRDDMIFMVLQAKDAWGRKPTINPDLLTIQESYLNRGDMFWCGIDENERVIGCIGCSRIPDTTEAFLHRLYVKPSLKRMGIGTTLLNTAENWMRGNGITVSKVHLGAPKEQWFESYNFYPKHGYVEYEPRYMLKNL